MRGLLIDAVPALELSVALDRAYRLNPRVSLRPEPFGALAYHFGNRRLSFLRSPDMVRLVEALGDHDTLASALTAAGIERRRWPSFQTALNTLIESDMIESDWIEAADD